MMSRYVLISTVLLFASCQTTSQFASSDVTKNYAQRTRVENIALFRSQKPSKKFIEIGTVNSCCSNNTNVLVDDLRSKASENGGDALTDLEVQATGGATATVIRYTE